MTRIDPTRTPSSTALRIRSVLAVLFGLAGVGAVWGWATAPMRVVPPAADLSYSSEAIARRAEAAFAETDAATRRAVPGARRAELMFFRGATSSVCAAGVSGRGVFYCPETGTAAFDLGYLESLVARLKGDAELAVVLAAARLAAEHRQRESDILDMAALDMIGARKKRRAEIMLGLALQADCLTGAWAWGTRSSLGAVPDDFWGRLVRSTRTIAADFASVGRPIPPELDTFGKGTVEEREAAFRRGYADASGTACPSPVTLVTR